MASFNKITIVGYLGRDPEIRYTSDGTPVCSFTVATTERKKDKAGDFQDITTWFRITTWRRLAEIANQYLSKGKQVYIEGKLSQSEYKDRDGNTRTTLEVQCSDLQFIGARGGDESFAPREEKPAGSRESAPPEMPGNLSDDDIPF